MGKKLDALLGRTFKAAKLKATVNLAISRLAVLKNQRQARLRHARSDVLELLQLGHHDRAALRVEHVIKDQNMLDVYDKIEGYCNLLFERVHLIEQERECPEELREAASGLLYAASRCGDFPEIQEIRAVLTTRFGKEFAARAIELRNNCGVHPQLIQKMSTRMPSLESRMKVLKDIASENGIVLQLEETSVSVEEQSNVEEQNQREPEKKEENVSILPSRGKDEELTDSFKAGQKYKDVAAAAQAAFESAAYAAAAARAALELSRSESHDPDDHDSPSLQPRKVEDGHDNMRPQLEEKEILSETQREDLNKDIDELQKPKDIISCNLTDEILKGATVSVDAEIEADSLEKEVVFDDSDDETDNKQNRNQSSKQTSLGYGAGIEVGSGSRQLVINTVPGSKMQSAPQLDLQKRPISVRTR
ncbi:IST protein [Spatholobus suberectus]|nr:IST protein [Spatholobus suberectus]